jgi:hypothetical protein
VPPPLTVLPTQTRRERGPAHNRRPVPTALPPSPLGENGERVEQTIEHLHELAELGFEVAPGSLAGVGTMRPLGLMAERVISAVEKF